MEHDSYYVYLGLIQQKQKNKQTNKLASSVHVFKKHRLQIKPGSGHSTAMEFYFYNCSLSGPTCPPDQFPCANGNCIPKDWACDGIADCDVENATDEDEDFCAACPFQFLCTNGLCTDLENVCDGVNHCRDDSDESQLCDIGKVTNVTTLHLF